MTQVLTIADIVTTQKERLRLMFIKERLRMMFIRKNISKNSHEKQNKK